jgi:hypothetical protein
VVVMGSSKVLRGEVEKVAWFGGGDMNVHWE